MSKLLREVTKDFQRAGLEVVIVLKKRHYFVMFEGTPVYKVSKSGKLPSWAARDRAAIIRSLAEERESRSLLR